MKSVLALRTFEYQAHYLNVLHMLGSQLSVPEIKISAGTLQEPAISVDLILDVGNSHTCGILVEDHPGEIDGLKHAYELHIRDLSRPHYLYNELFEKPGEFAQARFGKQNFSVESGRGRRLCLAVYHPCRPGSRAPGDDAPRHRGRHRHIQPPPLFMDEESYAPGWRFGVGTVNPPSNPPLRPCR